MKIIKTISAKKLKQQLKESQEKMHLGLGFGENSAYESNVEEILAKFNERKFDNKGGMGLGQGFKQMNEQQMVDFIANIVESLKGKTDYHNLKFVDNLATKYKLDESQIKNIKKCIKEDQSGKKVKAYINESIALEMQDMYEGYYGLTAEADVMIPEIKKCFNKNKKATGSVSEAVQMTAEELDLPMECVQEMYDKLKESYETQLEGAYDINEALSEIYNNYKGMSEGSMYEMYDEISEMMGFEEEEELNEVAPFSDEEMELFDDEYSDENSEFPDKDSEFPDEYKYNPFEEFDADNPEHIDWGVNIDENEECFECDQMDEEFDFDPAMFDDEEECKNIFEEKKKK